MIPICVRRYRYRYRYRGEERGKGEMVRVQVIEREGERNGNKAGARVRVRVRARLRARVRVRAEYAHDRVGRPEKIRTGDEGCVVRVCVCVPVYEVCEGCMIGRAGEKVRHFFVHSLLEGCGG